MKYLTCYKKLQADNMIAGGLGQGGGGYWQEQVGIELQRRIASVLSSLFHERVEFLEHGRPHGKDSFDRHPYTPPSDGIDAAYLQLFEIPTRRPARIVWSMISDYIGMTAVLEDFLSQVKPDFIINLQYPMGPPEFAPGLPQLGRLPSLTQQCARHNCAVYFLPWFNTVQLRLYNTDRDIPAMCTGKMSGTYPMRDACFKYLTDLGWTNIVLSGNPTGSTFTLDDEGYKDALTRARYYFSGGIYDLQIPPKYYEVCAYGACLVSPELPMMEQAGFIPHETYVPIKSVSEIPMIIESDEWLRVGKAGKEMVDARHGIDQRAEEIAQLIAAHMGKDY